MLTITEIFTAIDRGYEQLAIYRYDAIKGSGTFGDLSACSALDEKALTLYAYITALESIDFNHTIIKNKRIEVIYNNIKKMTKSIKLWD